MKRFLGMMPRDEVEVEKTYIDDIGYKITIQAGCNGWTIIWADGGTTSKDESSDAQKNFDKAYNTAVESLGNLKEV